METASEIRKIAFLGNYLPRKCGIAPFTADVLSAVAVVYPASQCFAVPVNDIPGGYEYPGQHAIFTAPNFSEGYCTDDNARAFILAVLLDAMKEELEQVRTLGTTYAAFLHHAFDPRTRRFQNHLSFDRCWLDEQGSEDSHGRALWALGLGVGRSPDRSFQVMSGQIFAQAPPADRVNPNQGAESTLAFLLSLAEMRLMQSAIVMVNPPTPTPDESFHVPPIPVNKGRQTGGMNARA